MNCQLAARASSQNDEMAHVPVKDAGEGKLGQFIQVQAQWPRLQADRSRQRNEIREARTAHGNGEPGSQLAHFESPAVVGGDIT